MVRAYCYETFFKSPGRGILKTSFERHRLLERVAADWLGLREDFCNLQWDCSYLMEFVDDVWDAWKLLFFQAVERNIPSNNLNPSVTHHG